MRVFVAGATGVIGRQLVPLLVEVGHEVIALARSDRRKGTVPGVELVTADALDRDAVAEAVAKARPDAVVHLLTAIPANLNLREIAKDFELTNRLRTEGTRNLVDAARDAGARRIITQGVAFLYEPAGGAPVRDEDAPLWTDCPPSFRPVMDALVNLERQTAAAGGLVLRYGHLYGPDTGFAPGGRFVKQIEAGTMPIVDGGGSVFSFTHTHDAATAVAAALDKPVTGALNIVDDTPVPVREWLPEAARLLGAPAPRRVTAEAVRDAVGDWGVAYMTQLAGADNARARLRLDWRPRYQSWREGFAAELGAAG